MNDECDVLFNVLDQLDEKSLKRFRFYLSGASSVDGLKPIPNGTLTSDVTDTVEKLLQTYGKENSLKIVKDILCKIGLNSLAVEVDNWMKRKDRYMNQMVESDEDQDWMRVSERHKAAMKKRFEYVCEGTVEGKKSKLNKIYTTLQNVRGRCEGVNTEHEIMEIEPQSRSLKWQDTEFDFNDLFSHRSWFKGNTKTVLTEGIGGIGKTVYIHKFILDWAEGKSNQHINFVFLLPFRKLNSIKDEQCSLLKLLQKLYPELEDLKDQRAFEHCKVMFIFDGLDESQLKFNFENTSQTVDKEITNLIEGTALPSAKIWITSRPAASRQIPSEYINQVIEAQGFTGPQKEEYFRKNLNDMSLAEKVIKHMKSIKSLFIMCHMPLFCWILATVCTNLDRTGRWSSQEFPTTLTEMLIHFLFVQINVKNKKQYNKYEDNKLELLKRHKRSVLKLTRLALEQLCKNNFVFSKDDLDNHGIDVRDASLHSGIFTEISQEDGVFFERKMYCFVHPIIQEFFAALYVLHTYTISNINEFKFLLRRRFKSVPPKVPLHEILNGAVDKALESANGHLDLFLRFLLGLSVDSNQELLCGLLPHKVPSSNSIKETCQTIREKFNENLPPERCINLFHCLLEMKNNTLYKEIQEYVTSGGIDLSPAHCSALASMLLMSEEALEEFDLRKYKTSEEGHRRLVPVVKWCKKALLTWCKLTDVSCRTVAPALRARTSHLTVLDLSCNDLLDSGVKLLSEGLLSPHCRLEVLRLAGCVLREKSCKSLVPALKSESNHLLELDLSGNDLSDVGIQQLSFGLESQNCKLKSLRLSGCLVSEQGCGFLATALTSNPTHLKELDLSYNHPGEDGIRRLLALPCKLEKLDDSYGGESRLKQGLRKYACELTLDPNTAHQNLSISEDNKMVAHVPRKISYPTHPDRFEYLEQVLCKEAISGRCYWEVKWTKSFAGVRVGVAYKGIERKGWKCDSRLGENTISWSMTLAKDQATAWHNNQQTARPAAHHAESSNTVGIYLDSVAGTLSFYTVDGDKLVHLHTFHDQFTEPLYPGFRVCFGTSVSLCPIA